MVSTRGVAIAGALVTMVALCIQYLLQFDAMPGVPALGVTWRYVGYFTILTNALCVAVWLGPALKRPSALNSARVEGMTMVAIAMVGIIYHALLAGTWRPQGLQWLANLVVHTVTPLLFLSYWLARPHVALSWWNALVFSLWPLTYCVYALTRGAFDGWYAYWFLNPRTTALPMLALSILALSVAFIVAGLLVIATDKQLAKRANRSPQPNASAPSAP